MNPDAATKNLTLIVPLLRKKGVRVRLSKADLCVCPHNSGEHTGSPLQKNLPSLKPLNLQG